MKLSCPQCNDDHNTENYSDDDVEIKCKCGYKILIPNFETLDQDGAWGGEAGGLKAAAAEMSGMGSVSHIEIDSIVIDDQAVAGDLDEPKQKIVEEKIPKQKTKPRTQATEKPPTLESKVDAILSGNLTDPNALPGDMVYDTFDLNNDDVMTPISQKYDSDESASQFTSSNILSRIQKKSVDQYIGPDYQLHWEKISDEALQLIKERCLEITKGRAWLEKILLDKKIDINNFKNSDHIPKIPEVFAVEIYLSCLSNGGNCRFKLVD